MSQQNTPDFSDLIGTPYSTMDCWAIVKEFYRRSFRIELKNYYEEIPKTKKEAESLIYSNMCEFKRVDGPLKYGDILLIKLMGVECHIAAYIGDGRILHTHIPTGCIIDSYKKWEKMVSGIFRIKE